jgi:site-specific DNA-adenine methylase
MKRNFFASASKSPATETQITPFYYHGQREGSIKDLFNLIPSKKYECFYDPFAGSGSLTFAAMERNIATRYFMNDSIPVLSCLWALIQRYPLAVISQYSEMATAFCSKSGPKRKTFYEQILKKFNEDFGQKIYAAAAISFLFLINFSDNKIPLFNKNSLATQADLFYDIQTLPHELQLFSARIVAVSKQLNTNPAKFFSGDFFKPLDAVTNQDLVFLDPPYPLQADNIYLKLKSESYLHKNIEQLLVNLHNKGVNFLVLYGARIVPRSLQFDEEKTGTQHLLRVSEHPLFGRFLDHIYISADITVEKLPPGMGFYPNFFKKDEEMNDDTYRTVLLQLGAERDVELMPSFNGLSKL